MASSAKKAVKQLLEDAREWGWRVRQHNRGGHTKLYSPDGEHIVVIPNSPSEYRSVKNCRAMVERHTPAEVRG